LIYKYREARSYKFEEKLLIDLRKLLSDIGIDSKFFTVCDSNLEKLDLDKDRLEYIHKNWNRIDNGRIIYNDEFIKSHLGGMGYKDIKSPELIFNTV